MRTSRDDGILLDFIYYTRVSLLLLAIRIGNDD